MQLMNRLFYAVVASVLMAGCGHMSGNYGDAKAQEIDVAAQLTVSGDAKSGFEFQYNAPFADEHGNFDFSQEGAKGNVIKLSFSLDGSMPGLRFRQDARDAMWIVEKEKVGPDGSPTGPYRGKQFVDFEVSEDGRRLQVTDLNNDGVLYRYGLRFDLDGKIVADDPDTQNGGNN